MHDEHQCSFDIVRTEFLEFERKGEFNEARQVKLRRCKCGKKKISYRIKDIGILRKGLTDNPKIEILEEYRKEGVIPLKKALKFASKKEDYYEISLRTLTPKLKMQLDPLSIQRNLETFCKQGFIELYYRYRSFGEPELRSVRIYPERYESFRNLFGIPNKEEQLNNLMQILQAVLIKLDGNEDLRLKKIRELLKEQSESIENCGGADIIKNGKKLASTKALEKYKYVIRSLDEIALIIKEDKYISFRELSLRVCGDTKKLKNYKKEIEELLDNIEEFNITDHVPLLFIAGNFGYNCRGHGSCLASMDYTVLTENTVKALEITDIAASKILLIENLTAFEQVVKKGLLGAGDAVTIWLSGYPSSRHKAIIEKILQFKKIPGYCWCDIDPDGIQIFQTVNNFFNESNCSLEPILMDVEALKKAFVKLRLSEEDKNKILDLKKSNQTHFRELLDYMLEKSIKAEQEVFLDTLRALEISKRTGSLHH
jgi:DNA topoisomerase VI subunit A